MTFTDRCCGGSGEHCDHGDSGSGEHGGGDHGSGEHGGGDHGSGEHGGGECESVNIGMNVLLVMVMPDLVKIVMRVAKQVVVILVNVVAVLKVDRFSSVVMVASNLINTS